MDDQQSKLGLVKADSAALHKRSYTLKWIRNATSPESRRLTITKTESYARSQRRVVVGPSQAMSSFGSSNRPSDDDGDIDYDPRLQSQRFDSFSNFDANSVNGSAGDSSPIFGSQLYTAGEDVFLSRPVPEAPFPPSIYSTAEGHIPFSPEQNGKDFSGDLGASNGPILPPPMDMEPDEGFALREWRR